MMSSTNGIYHAIALNHSCLTWKEFAPSSCQLVLHPQLGGSRSKARPRGHNQDGYKPVSGWSCTPDTAHLINYSFTEFALFLKALCMEYCFCMYSSISSGLVSQHAFWLQRSDFEVFLRYSARLLSIIFLLCDVGLLLFVLTVNLGPSNYYSPKFLQDFIYDSWIQFHE